MNTQFISLILNPLIISSLIALISGSIGYFINYLINKRKDLSSEFTAKRRGMYKEFTSIVIDIFKQSKAEDNNFEDKINKLYDFYKDYLLYASPGVINSFSDFFQLIFKSDEQTKVSTMADEKRNKEYTRNQFIYLARVIKAMRRDLGLNNRTLGKNGEKVFRALIKDFDDYFKH